MSNLKNLKEKKIGVNKKSIKDSLTNQAKQIQLASTNFDLVKKKFGLLGFNTRRERPKKIFF